MTTTNVLNDGTLDIATGRHRREVNWRNREIAWSDLVKKLKTTHRTAESYNEYLSAKKSRQDEIKDIGGFVGGYLANGRRKAGNVTHRQLITLDIDYGHSSFWDDYTMLYDNAAVIYSTHKHCPESPRLRLILPLDRPVFADEYLAISRRLAGMMGIDYFCHSTFRAYQLMYWPSTAKDGEFFYNFQDGPWVCADEILASYHDWKDSSEWPVSAREGSITQRQIVKQGDPLEKHGLIGAFCRTYSIAEAIEAFLTDVYETCAIPDRYTYRHGSTAAGLVVYDDKYAFSHHGTDPTSGKLCNAFDLVRLHKYGLKDEDAKEGTPGTKLPSYIEMTDFATSDPKVRIQLGSERLQEARAAFTDMDLEDEGQHESADDKWLAEMDVDRKGNYQSTINNIMLILNNDTMLKGRFAFNVFEQREIALKNLPWRKVTPSTKYLTDKDDAGVRHYMEKAYGITGVQKVKDAMDLVLQENSFHPVRDYLESLQWDGEERVETLLIDYLGAADTEYVRAVIRKTLAAAVTRIFRPGAKFDYVLTMVGKQGLYKSTLFDKLGRSWFSDTFTSVQGKEAFEQLQGVWIVEIAELSGLKKAEIETVKHFISKREDRYRVAYGRRIENFPRQCTFVGSTNNRDFLRDPTGNRRFWPVDIREQEPTRDVFKDLTDEEINQVWAEAMELYRQGEPLYLSKELEEQARKVQGEHSEHDERAGLIEKYLEKLLPVNWEQMDLYDRRSFLQGDDFLVAGTVRREKVCAAEIWCEVLGGMQREMNSHSTRFIHDIMRSMPGWGEFKSRTIFTHYGNQRAYYRKKISTVVFGQNTTVEPKIIENLRKSASPKILP